MDTGAVIVSALRCASAELGVELVAVVAESAAGVTVSLTSGEAAQVLVSPAALLRPVVAAGATSVQLLHTHLTPTPPSAADHAFTRRLRSACALLGVAFTGHVVVGPAGLQPCDGSDDRRAA